MDLHPPKPASDISVNKLDFSQTGGPLQEDGHWGVCVRDAAWRRAVGIQTPPERARPSTSSPGAWGETIGYYCDDEDSVFSTCWQRTWWRWWISIVFLLFLLFISLEDLYAIIKHTNALSQDPGGLSFSRVLGTFSWIDMGCQMLNTSIDRLEILAKTSNWLSNSFHQAESFLKLMLGSMNVLVIKSWIKVSLMYIWEYVEDNWLVLRVVYGHGWRFFSYLGNNTKQCLSLMDVGNVVNRFLHNDNIS